MESNASSDILWGTAAMDSVDEGAEQGSRGPTAWTPVEHPLEASGTKVAFVGQDIHVMGTTSVRANHPVPQDCQVYYFEVEVVGRDSEDGVVGVGFAADEVDLEYRAPGWERNSCGYHGDDGKAFSGGGIGRPYGPCFGTGDWVGIVLNRSEGTVSFSLNGVDLGVACEGIPADLRLFPVVGLRMAGDEVDANFGCDLVNRPFKGSPASIRQEPLSRLLSRTLHARLPGAQLSPNSPWSLGAQHPQPDVAGCWLAPASLLHWAVQHARPPPHLASPLPEALETESIDEQHRTPLLLAASRGDDEWVEALIRMGADVQAATRMGQTALVFAAAAGQERAIQALLAAGAEVDPQHAFEGSPLTTAAAYGRLGAVRLLAAAGADLEALFHGRTALMLAADGGHAGVVEALVKLGANPAQVDHRGHTALHHFIEGYAVWGKPQSPQLLRVLLAALGANAAARAQLFQTWPTPLDLLLRRGPDVGLGSHSHELAKMLAEAGCPLNLTLPPTWPSHGPTLLTWLECLVSRPATWPQQYVPAGVLGLSATLLQCAAEQAAAEGAMPAAGAAQGQDSCALLLAAIRVGNLELVRMVAEAFPQCTAAGRAVGVSLDCLLQKLWTFRAPQEAWQQHRVAPVLGWCKLVGVLLELGCSPLTVVVDEARVLPATVRIHYNGTSEDMPDWAAEPLRELLVVVAAGRPWSEDRHAAFPPAFRKAARALLLLNNRLSQEWAAPALSGDVIRCILRLAAGGSSVLAEWVPPLRPFAVSAARTK